MAWTSKHRPGVESSSAPSHASEDGTVEHEVLIESLVVHARAQSAGARHAGSAGPNYKVFASRASIAPPAQVAVLQETELTQVQITQKKNVQKMRLEEAQTRRKEDEMFKSGRPSSKAKAGRKAPRAPVSKKRLIDADDDMVAAKKHAGAPRGRARSKLMTQSQATLELASQRFSTQPAADEGGASLLASAVHASSGGAETATAAKAATGRKPVSRKRARAAMVVD